MVTSRASLFSDPRSEAKKPATAQLRWGQVPTPEAIGLRMAERLFWNRTTEPVSILDPCVGLATFPRVLSRAGVLRDEDELTLIDIDPKMIAESSKWARERGLKFTAKCADYVGVTFKPEYDYAIFNPPYVRQEWLDRKEEYSTWFQDRYALQVPGTSNLYVYFIIKVLNELRPGGKLACIVYDSWQFTRFGKWLSQILEKECDSITMEPEANQPFRNRLIDATVIYAQKCRTHKNGPLRFASPLRFTSPLSTVEGFCVLTQAFQSQRGLRLKQADFFLCDLGAEKKLGATPFVKKVSKFSGYQVPEDHREAALLLSPANLKASVSLELKRRLREAKKKPQDNISILTWFKERPKSWMLHRPAPRAQIIFNYYMRNRPRHILNPRHAYSDNFYGLIAREGISPVAWLGALNSTATCIEILSRSRNQGNGLAKVQLFEYRDVHVPDLRICSRSEVRKFEQLGLELLDRDSPGGTLRRIDELVAAVFPDSRLKLPTLYDIFAETDQKARKPKEAAACLG
jgi:hypothetical protein